MPRPFKILSGSLLAFCLAIPVVATAADDEASPDADTVISRSDELPLTVADYRRFLSGPDKDGLLQMTHSQNAMRDTVLDYHSNVVLARRAESLKLQEQPRVAALLARARRNILVEALAAKLRSEADVPDDLAPLARERYAADRERFRVPEKRRVAHILLSDIPGCECANDDTTPLEEANALREELADGADFAELARAHSTDRGTAGKGGELPAWLSEDGKTVPAFETAVFSLAEAGDISEPVETQYGVHLIKLLEVRESNIPPYDEVADRILAKVAREIRDSAVQQARSEAYPDPNNINYEALDQVAEELGRPAPRN